MATALVTGATSGIGLTFARHLAARGDDVVLVARNEERLNGLAEELRSGFSIEVEVLPADLGTDEGIERVRARLSEDARPIEMLVNNAGFGLHANLVDPDLEEVDHALKVMCYAVVALGAAAAKAMRSRGHGTIINTGSTAGWLTTGLYSAVKAFVNTYSESLATELHGTGVHVTNLAPGWVKTEFHERAGIKAELPGPVWIDVDELVATALRDADKGRVWSVPTRRWQIAGLGAQHLLPRQFLRWFSRALNSSRKK